MKKALKLSMYFFLLKRQKRNHHNHQMEGNWKDKICGLSEKNSPHSFSIQIRQLQTGRI